MEQQRESRIIRAGHLLRDGGVTVFYTATNSSVFLLLRDSGNLDKLTPIQNGTFAALFIGTGAALGFGMDLLRRRIKARKERMRIADQEFRERIRAALGLN